MKRALVLPLFLATTAFAAKNPTLPPGADRALVEVKCSSCHTLSRVVRRGRDRAEWTATVTLMRGKGLRVTDAEFERLLNYLSSALGPNTTDKRH